MKFRHVPVLLDEVVDVLKPASKKTIVDCTLGGGGHALAMRLKLAPSSWLIGIDQDSDALQAAQQKLSQLGNIELRKGNFSQLKELLADWQLPLDGFLFDLGVSSWQLDSPQRGFAYQHDAFLDMRMNRDASLRAYDIVNTWPQTDLTYIFRNYGEEKWSARIAEFIIKARSQQPVETTGQLVELIKAAIPAAARRDGGHPGRRVFQALRIAVNTELDSIRQGLNAAIDLCAPQGVVAVISYHSLEDRIVKHIFKDWATGCNCPPEVPVCTCGRQPQVKILTRRPIVPRIEEVESNPRARSAKLRAITKF